jgi:biopolymer transport protein ExbD
MGEGVGPLKETIARIVGNDRDRPVIIRADALTANQNVVTAMDALGQLGFTKLSIATTPSTEPAAK